ncbi:10464_t:CDS:2 [Acaulospora colombiana]|uniref:10464_t:CDS:1 n=1 Tax=Acaulospora colombiana TaxID=27376 RepID=A0ACA9JUW2_9GLOM|nr:10464_t:CDS:2 [Acaulospora colombiana]
MPIITLALNFTILSVTLFSYTMTLREINSVNFCQERATKFDTAATKSKQIEPVVVRKIVGYVLIFLFQWTPPMIYVFSQVIDYDEMWIYIVTDATINLGGVGNMIQYIINEGWWDNHESPTTSVDSSITPPTYNTAASSSTENHRKSRNIKEDTNDTFDNGFLSPPKSLFSPGHLSQITVEEVVTVIIEESPPLSTNGETPSLFRSRPNSIVSFNVDPESDEKKQSSHAKFNSTTREDIDLPMIETTELSAVTITAPSPATCTAPSPTISIAIPSQTIIATAPSPTISNTAPSPTISSTVPSPTISSTAPSPTITSLQNTRNTPTPKYNVIQTLPRYVTNKNTAATTSSTESSDQIRVNELDQIIIRHDKAVLKRGGSLARQGGTMLHGDHGLRSIRSEEGINRHFLVSSSQGSNGNGDSNGSANIEVSGSVKRFVSANNNVGRSISLNNGSLGRSRSESLNSNNSRRGRSGSESSHKGLIRYEGVNDRFVKQSENFFDEADEYYFM